MPRTKEPLEAEFARLAEQRQRQTIHHSFMDDILNHPAYLQITEMGESALPLIFQELECEPSRDWLAALRAISGVKPPRSVKAFDEHVAWWLKWGRKKGYI